MKRDIYAELLAWKSSSRRKPLLLQGARQGLRRDGNLLNLPLYPISILPSLIV